MIEQDGRILACGVQYLNARPLYEGLGQAPFSDKIRLDLGLPFDVARRIAEDEAHVALMPVAAAAAIGDLRITRGAGICADGAVRSVAIFSEKPIDQLTEISLDLSSRTSVILAKLILRRLGLSPRLIGRNANEARESIGGTRGALLIGDPALEIEARVPMKLDLAAEWKEWTGLPFVFAAWCAREGALQPEHEALLLQAKERGLLRRN